MVLEAMSPVPSSPFSLSPQQYSSPPVLMPQANKAPAAMALRRMVDVAANGVGLQRNCPLAMTQTPARVDANSPSLLFPQQYGTPWGSSAQVKRNPALIFVKVRPPANMIALALCVP